MKLLTSFTACTSTGPTCSLSPGQPRERRQELLPSLFNHADDVSDMPNGLWWIVPSVLALGVFARLLTFHPFEGAGRVYAAYGGLYCGIAPLALAD